MDKLLNLRDSIDLKTSRLLIITQASIWNKELKFIYNMKFAIFFKKYIIKTFFIFSIKNVVK